MIPIHRYRHHNTDIPNRHDNIPVAGNTHWPTSPQFHCIGCPTRTNTPQKRSCRSYILVLVGPPFDTGLPCQAKRQSSSRPDHPSIMRPCLSPAELGPVLVLFFVSFYELRNISGYGFTPLHFLRVPSNSVSKPGVHRCMSGKSGVKNKLRELNSGNSKNSQPTKTVPSTLVTHQKDSLQQSRKDSPPFFCLVTMHQG